MGAGDGFEPTDHLAYETDERPALPAIKMAVREGFEPSGVFRPQ